MNASEFEQALGAAPRETAEARRAGEADPARDAAVADALAFEDRLEAALRVAVDEEALLAGILETPMADRTGDAVSPDPDAAPERRGLPGWLAMAASVFVIAGVVAVLLWPSPPPQDLGEYVRSHYLHDGPDVLARADQGMEAGEVDALFAALGAEAGPEFTAGVRYAKFCPTPDGRGAHMVLGTSEGPVTVIYMPNIEVDGPVLLEFDDVQAQVVALSRGSAAIIGAGEGAMRELKTRLETGIRPLAADA